MPEIPTIKENPEFLTDQLITYIGNKRALLPLIGRGIGFVQKKLNREKLDCLDVFSGSGIVSRFLKQYARTLTVNDLEQYAETISSCYLANRTGLDMALLREQYDTLRSTTATELKSCGNAVPGFITEFYAPHTMGTIRSGERCFYTPGNARYIDIARQTVDRIIPVQMRPFFIAPLLSEASVHANTAGVFKGFYKNTVTGIGQFGGNGRNALSRITGSISLPFPVFSRFECPCRIFRRDANALAQDGSLYDETFTAEHCFDLAYIDPPYNQHPYGSNYFMLNLIASYRKPDSAVISRVSGIPRDWNRSLYNRRKASIQAFAELAASIRSKFLLVSFNSEGFIGQADMLRILEAIGTVTILSEQYNTFRGARNLHQRNIHLSEFLYIVQKNEIGGNSA